MTIEPDIAAARAADIEDSASAIADSIEAHFDEACDVLELRGADRDTVRAAVARRLTADSTVRRTYYIHAETEDGEDVSAHVTADSPARAIDEWREHYRDFTDEDDPDYWTKRVEADARMMVLPTDDGEAVANWNLRPIAEWLA